MVRSSRRSKTALQATIIILAAPIILLQLVGCAAPHRAVFLVDHCRLDVDLDPQTHNLSAAAILEMRNADQLCPDKQGPVAVRFWLHPALSITDISTSGAKLREWHEIPPNDETDGASSKIYEVILASSPESMAMRIRYAGSLQQDVQAGESAMSVHNLTMRAHISEEGVYLSGNDWYPWPAVLESTAPQPAEFILTANKIPNMTLTASGERDELSRVNGDRLAWRSPYPIDGLALVGGPLVEESIEHGNVRLTAFLAPHHAGQARSLLDAVGGYLDRYEPLLGPYPTSQFSVVENFFSSGFAFPNFTLLSPGVIAMGKRAQMRHGMLDHEFVHGWWGNGVLVDPRDGNWCEALTSYCTNYFGHVLDGDESQARRTRRNYVHNLSRLSADNEYALDSFGQDDSCPRQIGYEKGAMVLHMLSRRIGQEVFWKCLQKLASERVGKLTSWDDIRDAFESGSGKELDEFFTQWVRQPGMPDLSFADAWFNEDTQTLNLKLLQGPNSYDLLIPITVSTSEGPQDLAIPMSHAVTEASLKVSFVPTSVTLDPDYHLLRRVSVNDVVPTTAKTRCGTAFTCVTPSGDIHPQYEAIRAIFERGFSPDQRTNVIATSGQILPLADRSTLVMGNGVYDGRVRGFLEAIRFPVRFTDGGFEYDGNLYSDPADAVLCTVSHPGVTGGGITVVFANSGDAVPRASIIPMYNHSLVIFKSGRAVVREDFERQAAFPVRIVSEE